MARTSVVTIDLNFQNKTQAIASYLIRYADGAILIESGPGSTLSALEASLAKEGLTPRVITHVLLTHIHIDHAGETASSFAAVRHVFDYFHAAMYFVKTS